MSLIREGDWELFPYHVKTTMLQSYIKHVCPEGGNWYWYTARTIEHPCRGCGECPNPSVLGAWKLHNWDYLQHHLGTAK